MTVSPPGRSNKVGDHLVVLNSGRFVEVTEEDGNGNFNGHALVLGALEHQEGDLKLPWHAVGVHLVAGLQAADVITFRKEDVKAKALRCGNVVSEWLPSWFASKRDG